MISEKENFLFDKAIEILDKFIEYQNSVNNLKEIISDAIYNLPPYKSYLKKDENNNFNIIDNKNSIKCIFKKNYLQAYFNQLPSYLTINSYNSCLIFIKKSYFDIIYYKISDNEICAKIILVIEQFNLDQCQKINNDLLKYKHLNINDIPTIQDKISNILLNKNKEFLDNDFQAKNLINEHLLYIENNYDIVGKKYKANNNYKKLKSYISIINNKDDSKIFFLCGTRIDFIYENDLNNLLNYIITEINLKTANNNKSKTKDIIITKEKLNKLYIDWIYDKKSRVDENKSSFLGKKKNMEKEPKFPTEIKNFIDSANNQKIVITREIFKKYLKYKKIDIYS